jgi:protein TonB
MEDSPPWLIKDYLPQYPYNAKENNIEGWVLLRFVVGIDGKVKEPEVVDAEPQGVFEQSALDAIMQSEFKPATKNGTPVLCILEMKIGYGLDQSGDKERFSVMIKNFTDD